MSPAEDIPDGDAWPDAPAAVDGCLECSNLALRRTHALETRDPTAETDANVLMRAHAGRAHA